MANRLPSRLAATSAATPLDQASEALALLLEDRVVQAEQLLRRALTSSPPPDEATRACLLSDVRVAAIRTRMAPFFGPLKP